jgi:hypothetical protein
MSKGVLVGIPVRRMQFKPEDIAENYYDNDPLITVFWNTLSMLFPEGEQFFVRAVRAAAKDAGLSSTLNNAISGFIGQEAFHTLGHKQFNAILKKQGYPVDAVDKYLNKVLGFISNKNPRFALYITCILEHYTSTLAGQLLDNPEHNAAVLGAARNMWLHHAVEEVEHRSVSFDVLMQTKGSKVLADMLFIPVSIVFAAAVSTLFVYNLSSQKVQLKDLRSGTRLVKLLLRNTDKLKDWFTKDFHPNKHSSANIHKIKEELKL